MKNKKSLMIDKLLIKMVAETALSHGYLKDTDLQNRQTLMLALQKMMLNESKESIGVVDHRSDILRQAAIFEKDGMYEYANVFYAMYFEHTANLLIDHFLNKKGLKSQSKEIIRQVQIHGKYGWLLALLGMKPFSQKHLVVIRAVCDSRNGFIHYKWTGWPLAEPMTNSSAKGDKGVDHNTRIKATIAYVKRYEREALHNRKIGRLKQLLAD